MLRTLVFFSLITSANASLDDLVNAAQSFAAAIDQQTTTDQSDPAPTDFAEKTIATRTRILLQSVEGRNA
jgi:hypothetical protein